MPKDPKTILAINPGSRYVGFAAFRGPDLLDWGVRVIRATTPRASAKIACSILFEAIERFHPDTLAVKALHSSRSSPALDHLTDSIIELARRRRIRVCPYSIGQLKIALLRQTKGNKRGLAERVVALYPVLAYDFQRETSHLNPYHVRMFEAVALGIVCYRHLDE